VVGRKLNLYLKEVLWKLIGPKKPGMVRSREVFKRADGFIDIFDEDTIIFFHWTCGSSTTCYSHLTTTTDKTLSVTWVLCLSHRLLYILFGLVTVGLW
jgi:hypothetical protein